MAPRGNHNTGMDAFRAQTANLGPAALAAGVAAVALAQIAGGAPVAAAIALCTWGAARITLPAAGGSLRLVAVSCAAIGLLAICAQLDLATRAASPLWRGVLLTDIFIGAILLGSLAREAVRR